MRHRLAMLWSSTGLCSQLYWMCWPYRFLFAECRCAAHSQATIHYWRRDGCLVRCLISGEVPSDKRIKSTILIADCWLLIADYCLLTGIRSRGELKAGKGIDILVGYGRQMFLRCRVLRSIRHFKACFMKYHRMIKSAVVQRCITLCLLIAVVSGFICRLILIVRVNWHW